MNGIFVGNVSLLNTSAETEELELPDSTSPGGGLWNSLDRVAQIGYGFEFSDYNGHNLAMALYGTSEAIIAGQVPDEAHTVPSALGTLIKTAQLIDTADVAATVTVDTDPVTTPFVLDTDYTVSAAGIIPLEGGSMTADSPILISYDNLAHDLIQAYVNSGLEYDLVFDGLNAGQPGSPPLVINIFKGKNGPTEGLDFINAEDFASAPITGKMIKDTTKVGTGLSQYMTIAVA